MMYPTFISMKTKNVLIVLLVIYFQLKPFLGYPIVKTNDYPSLKNAKKKYTRKIYESEHNELDVYDEFRSSTYMPGLTSNKIVEKDNFQSRQINKKERICGVDLSKRIRRDFGTEKLTIWKNSTLTWALENSNNDGISDLDVRQILKVAFERWETVTYLHFVELINQPSHSADIRIRFEIGLHQDDRIAFDGRGGVYAHAFLPGKFPPDLAGDIHFDDAEEYTVRQGAPDRYVQLSWVATHEIGHSLGLGHSPVKGAIMYAVYPPTANQDRELELTFEDIKQIQKLYGEKKVNTSKVVNPKPTESSHSPHPIVECTDTMEAAFIGDNDKLHFISNQKFYMLHFQNKEGVERGPQTIETYFPGIQKIDSVFRRPDDKYLVVFHGDKFSVFQGKHLIYPARKLNDGFQYVKEKLENIDAALVWPETNKLYVFKGEVYWRFSQLKIHEGLHVDYIADFGYPRNIVANWRGLPKNISTAFHWTNNKIYFTKGDLYYRWNMKKDKVNDGYPIKLTKSFLKCH